MQNKVSPNDRALANYRIGFVIEWMLGHITHGQNLAQYLHSDSTIQSTWMQITSQADDIWQNLPGYNLKVSLRAWDRVRAALHKDTLDCLFYHTPMIGMFSLGLMQRIPTVISLDATFINFLRLAAAYQYGSPNRVVYWLKFEWYRRMYQSAAALISMSNWAKQSLVQDYGVASDKVTVIFPGVDLCQWCPSVKEVGKGDPLRLLFVGGDFERKGGHILLEAFRCGLAERCTLDIVTKDETVHSQGAVRVHRGLEPNSPLLLKLFADADLFVFPTLGDTNAIVVMEAMASGLPVLATNVGALAEEVEDGVTGLLVPPNDPGAIVEAIRSLANTPDRLVAMGAAGRARAERLFDAKHNYKAVVDVLKRCVNERRNRA